MLLYRSGIISSYEYFLKIWLLMQHALWSSQKWYSVDHLPNSSPKCPNWFILIRRFKGDKFVNELERNVTCVAHLEDLIWMNCWETVFYLVLVWVIMLKLTYWGLEQIWFLLFIEELMLTDLPGGFFLFTPLRNVRVQTSATV